MVRGSKFTVQAAVQNIRGSTLLRHEQHATDTSVASLASSADITWNMRRRSGLMRRCKSQSKRDTEREIVITVGTVYVVYRVPWETHQTNGDG